MNDSTLDAVWVIDSETGERLLLDRKTNKVIARGDQNGISEPLA